MTLARPSRRGPRGRLVALIAATILSAAVVPMASAASPEPTTDGAAVAIPVTMHLDCSSVPATREARAALRRYHVCGLGTGGPMPQSIVDSNCGSLSLFVSNNFGGALQWRGRITSKLGPFVSASYAGNWSNLTNGRSGPVSRSYSGITSDWLDIFPINTGVGSAFGNISVAAVRLWWGAWCVSTFPVDSHATVT